MPTNPCCCPGCVETVDEFDSAFDTDVWEVIAGGATNSGGRAVLDPNSVILLEAESTDGSGHVTGSVYFGANGDEADIYFAYLDANNHWRLRITYTANATNFGTVSLFKMDGGVETEIGPVHAMRADGNGGTGLLFDICWLDRDYTGDSRNRIMARTRPTWGSAVAGTQFDWPNHISGGNRCGMGSGAVVSTVEFESFEFANSAGGSGAVDPCDCILLMSVCNTCYQADFSGDWLLEDISGPFPAASTTLSWPHLAASINNRVNITGSGAPAGSNYWIGLGGVPGVGFSLAAAQYAAILYCDSLLAAGDARLVLFGISGDCSGDETFSDCADPITFTVTCAAGGPYDYDVTPL